MHGFCLAIMRMAESDIRVPARTTPSTVGSRRSRAARSRRPDSCASASRMVDPPADAAVCAPRITSAKKGLPTSDTISAIICVRAVDSARASGLVRYPSWSAAVLIRSAVAALTRPGRENARETVEGATPAERATS